MPEYPRSELEEMMKRWVDANAEAEKAKDWTTHLGPFYTDDAEYRWNMGPNQEFWARGRKEIEELALGWHMEGFEGWQYPYDALFFDEPRGEVLGLWRQLAPFNRSDGSPYEIAGVGGSWFRYAGDFKWSWQRDFFDLGNAKAIFFELAGAGKLNDTVKAKIHAQAKGELMPGVEHLHPEPSRLEKARNFAAMARIALFG